MTTSVVSLSRGFNSCPLKMKLAEPPDSGVSLLQARLVGASSLVIRDVISSKGNAAILTRSGTALES